MRGTSIRVGQVGFALGLVVAGSTLTTPRAEAGNSEHPRTPVHWPEADCIQTVVRAVDPVVAFDYAIPLEDTLLSIDELPDSRTHQFIGFCRQWPAGRPPPRYVSVADLERAIDADFELPVTLDDPEATLETSAIWADCWTRITPDDARRPITFAAASVPVAWDTSALALGTWVVAGYTWEPPYNLWSRAPWVVRVVDEDLGGPVQAAAALADSDDAMNFDETVELALCVDADVGASVSIEWATTDADPSVALVWAPVPGTVSTLTSADEQIATVPFSPPEPSWGATILLRANVEPLEAPAYISDALASMTVFKPPSDDPDDSGGSETADEESGDSGESSDEAGLAPDDPARAGRCSLVPERGNLPAALLFAIGLLALVRARPGQPEDRP